MVVEDTIMTTEIDLVVEAIIIIVVIVENIETIIVKVMDMTIIEIDTIGVEVVIETRIEVGVEKELMQRLLTHHLDIKLDLGVETEI